MSRRQPKDPAIEGLLEIDETAAQVLADDPFVRLRETRQPVEELAELRPPGESPFVGAIVERPDPERVAGAEQPAAPPVPDREREITDKPRDAIVAAERVGLQQDFRVGTRPEMDARRAQRCGELTAVVDPPV